MNGLVLYPCRSEGRSAGTRDQSDGQGEDDWLRPCVRGPCTLCEKVQPYRATCERMGGNVVCKQCCIEELRGHKCEWWDLCWNI